MQFRWEWVEDSCLTNLFENDWKSFDWKEFSTAIIISSKVSFFFL